MVNYDISKVFGALPEIIKGLPMTLLVILLTTLLGSLLGGLVAWASLSKDKALVTMVLLFSAMISEVFKAAYQAIPKGQLEAGLSIGLTSEQTFVRIIAPQAFKVALPNITTAILNLMRDAALAYTIGFIDVMGKGNLLISRHLGNYSLETYTAVAFVYWGIALILSLISRIAEQQLSVKER